MFAGPRGSLMKLLLFSADVREAGRDVVIKTSVPYMVNKPTDHLVRFCLYLKGCKKKFLKKKKDLQHVTYKTYKIITKLL